MKKMKKMLAVLIGLAMLVSLAACSGEKQAEPEDDNGGKWKIALSNSFIGNDWRQEMQTVTELVAKDPYYADRLTLDIINCENTPEAQTASINALVEKGYDAILIDAASNTGIDNALKNARDKGVVIVLFDNVVDDDSYVRLEPDFAYVAQKSAEFIAESCGYKGNVIVDRGLNGAAVAKVLYDNAVQWFEENTEMVVVSEFESEFAEGPAEQGVTAAMTASSQIDAVFSQGYIAPIARAFRNAGRDIPVITGAGLNGTGIDVLTYGDYDCLQWNCNLAGVGSLALEQAVQMLEGKEPAEKHQYINDAQWNSTRPELGEKLGIKINAFEEGKTVFSQYPAGLQWPVLPEDFPVQVNIEDLVKN